MSFVMNSMRSEILNDLSKIENKGRNEYIQKTNLQEEMQMVLKSFFYANREHLPENPFPEITKRFRQIEVRVRRQKSAEIVDDLIIKSKHSSSSSTVTTLPTQLFNMPILSSTAINHYARKDQMSTDDSSIGESSTDESVTVYGLKHVINGICDMHWIESICSLLSPILSSIKTTMDQCLLTKISLISSPIFFYDSYEFLKSLSTKHILYAHLFPQKQNAQSNIRVWPYFMSNGQINVYHHVGIMSISFQKAVSVFSKFIQQQIYWITVTSKKIAKHKFFFKHCILNDTGNNPHIYTFDEIFKKNKKKFETNIKHAIAQKHTVKMIFYFIGPDDILMFKCEVYFYFYFKDNKSPKTLEDINTSNQNSVWTSFAVDTQQIHHSIYHGFFTSYNDIDIFSDFYTTNNATLNRLFIEWKVKTWTRIVQNLDKMQYGQVIPDLNWLAILTSTDSTTLSEDVRKNILTELRLTLLSHGQLFQGFEKSICRIIDVLKIIFREIKEHKENLKEERNSNSNTITDIDYRMAGEWIHKLLMSTFNRFVEICDFQYPLYSEYLHCIPRIKYLFIQCIDIIPSWMDLSKISYNMQVILCDEYLNEIEQVFNLIGGALNCDELLICVSTRQWIQQKREVLKSVCRQNNKKQECKQEYIPLNNVMVIKDAMNYNIKKRKLPSSIPLKGTLLQYMIDTEIDKWFSEILFKILSDSFVFNPFVAVVIDAQLWTFKFNNYKQSDCEIYGKIVNLNEIKEVNNVCDIQHLYSYQGVYGFKSALMFIDSNAMKNIYKNICSKIPTKILIENNKLDIKNYDILLSVGGYITHYPYFAVALNELEITQNVFISGQKFDDCCEMFACHCWHLSHNLFKSSSVIFISLNINQNKYHSDIIIKNSNYQNVIKKLVQAVKSRQSIYMDLMISAVNKYVSCRLNLFLIYHELKTTRYRLCWPFKPDIIFTSIFFEINHAIKFWRAYSVGNIANEYNLERKEYKKELMCTLQMYQNNAQFDSYFHTMLQYKSLNNDLSGINEIYRFFQPNTLCGISIESLNELTLIHKLLDYRKISRYIKNQMNRQITSKQIKQCVNYSKNVIFSDLLTFFDRNISTYLKTYYFLETVINNDDQMHCAMNQMINLLIPIKNASVAACFKMYTY